jgi:hypothetical protein
MIHVDGLLPRRPGFDSGAVRAKFMVDETANGLGLSPSTYVVVIHTI